MERIFKLQNLNCANCASVIETKLNQLESVSAATFTLGTQQLRITSSIEDTDMLRDQIQGSIINVGVTPLRCHFQHYFFAKK